VMVRVAETLQVKHVYTSMRSEPCFQDPTTLLLRVMVICPFATTIQAPDPYYEIKREIERELTSVHKLQGALYAGQPFAADAVRRTLDRCGVWKLHKTACLLKNDTSYHPTRVMLSHLSCDDQRPCLVMHGNLHQTFQLAYPTHTIASTGHYNVNCQLKPCADAVPCLGPR
jgi:hypothetical protein